ncbi:hypothetical protein CONPUDRAFT_136257 [Coniophora puteana RWD-64-598 SS2]|uniref:Uncharacterized protein n=1 Tax=Coniophora puteana (strain RWD-64-598) TaxID=741705 RepID=A0A5M3MVD3_CONPW|nr:uncharacterized protein CONPUDRAFT_136257 [Coniophora puteana RWD-64-598 SS2]EIW83109.1 hypothetical protein CONPUDRAFT_136257 [Coniophora puteana RWD-64-598 SS2]
MDLAHEPPTLLVLEQNPDPRDPPPPYPSPNRRVRSSRVSHRNIRRLRAPGQLLSGDSDQEPSCHTLRYGDASNLSNNATEATPLLNGPPRCARRPRSQSFSSTSSSGAPSLAQTVASLFQPDLDDDNEVDIYDALHIHGPGSGEQQIEQHANQSQSWQQWPLLSRRAWRRYFKPLTHRAYYAALLHLMVLNFPFALAAWVYLFVFTLTGTTLLITLPIGAVLCFFDLLGARAFARAELALQRAFHGPLAHAPPYPTYPIFRRMRPTRPDEETGRADTPQHEPSFYKNAYSMFTDSTTYSALFYFLVIKPGITLIFSLCLIVAVPLSVALVLPAPLVLRVVRKLGIWQANVAVEGLCLAVL